MAVVYHWKHGWIPLDHEAALSKSKGNHAAAAKMMADAPHATGIKSRQDVAKAALDLPNVPASHRAEAQRQLRQAAETHGATDLLPRVSGDAQRLDSFGFPDTRKRPENMTGPELDAEQRRLNAYIAGRAGNTASHADVQRWQTQLRTVEAEKRAREKVSQIEAEQKRLKNYIAGRAGGTATSADVGRWTTRLRKLEAEKRKL